MTAAQGTLTLRAPNRWATYAAAVAAGLLVAVIGIAISARPIAEPQSLAYPNHPVVIVPTTSVSNAPFDAYMAKLNAKAASAKATNEPFDAYMAKLNAKAAAVKSAAKAVTPTIAPSFSPSADPNAYIQFELQRHADAFGPGH